MRITFPNDENPNNMQSMSGGKKEQSERETGNITRIFKPKKYIPKCQECGISFEGLKLYIDKYCFFCYVKLAKLD